MHTSEAKRERIIRQSDARAAGARSLRSELALLGSLVAGLALANMAAAGQLTAKWTINTSDIFAGRTFGAGHQGCQTVWDIDGDGTNEIIFGTRRGDSKRLWCFDARANFEWIYPPIDQDGLPGDPLSKVSLIDVNRDSRYELCLAGRGGRLHVLDGKGHLIWSWDDPNIGADIEGPPQAFDVDGDGYIEFFLGDSRGCIHRVTHQGERVWSLQACGKFVAGQPTVADIDRDGGLELLVASDDWFVYCLDARTGSEEWRFNTTANCAGPVIVVDVNSDGEYEALVWDEIGRGESAGCLFCLSFFGAQMWNFTLPQPGRVKLVQTVGDVDGDGSLEIAAVSDTVLCCIDIGGDYPVLEWEINVTKWVEEGRFGGAVALASAWSSYTLMADIDGDERQELLWLVPFPMVTDASTGALEAYYCNPNVAQAKRQENGGWWGDVDNDGMSEWIVELNGKYHLLTEVYCLTMNGKFPTISPWPEYYHTAYPAEYQKKQDWLTLKAAYSNSLWFPMPEASLGSAIFLLANVFVRKKYGRPSAPKR